MSQITEPLPENDGAVFTCCFVFDGWECDSRADLMLTKPAEAEVRTYLKEHPKSPVHLRARGLCNKHLAVIRDMMLAR